MLDISRSSSCTRADNNSLDISVNRLSLMSNSLREVRSFNIPLGSSLRRFSSSARRLRLIVSRKIETGNSISRFLPSNNSSRFPRPRNVPEDNDDMRLDERSSKAKSLLLRKRSSGKLRSLFDDRSLNRIKWNDIKYNLDFNIHIYRIYLIF